MPATLRCEIFPADLDASVAFYVDALGFEIARDARHCDRPYVALARGRARVGAAQRAAMADPGTRRPPVGVELVLEVDDLERDRERVAATGWPVSEEITERPWGLRDFRLLDPDGYYWRITTPA